MFKAKSLKDVLIHIVIMFAFFVLMVILFFYYYLPSTTHHGETISVPKLVGMQLPELDGFLKSKGLRFQINDSTYIPEMKPNTVLSQHPLPGTHVKENRMLYISVSSKNPPKVKMPKLVDGSLKSAEIALKGIGLTIDEIKYVPSPFSNLVIDQMLGGKSIPAGAYVSKGSKINLVVGNGSQAGNAEVPNLLGKDVEEAKNILIEKGLMIGLTLSDENSTQTSGTIIRQQPETGKMAKMGDMVDVTISGKQ